MIGLRFWISAAVLIVLPIVGIYMVRGAVLPAVARWLDVGRPPRPSDFLMVLDGDRKWRPKLAAAIFKARLARKVLVALPIGEDGGEKGDITDLPERPGGCCARISDVPFFPLAAKGSMSAALVRSGVPENDVATLPRKVANTHDEALALAAFLQSRPGASATVVTSGYHTRRAELAFGQVLGHDSGRVSFVSAPADWCESDNWWQTESGRHTVALEYGKLAFYLLRYGPFHYYTAAAATLVAAVLIRRQLR